MTTSELDKWFNSVLNIKEFQGVDSSKNGLQVANDGSKIKKVAFAVDACLASFQKAKQTNADLLFVHHGIFWRDSFCLVENNYTRVKFLMENNLALYACHLPLDANETVGHNAGLAQLIGLENIEAFGIYKGVAIGSSGSFSTEISLDELLSRLFPSGETPLSILPFGPKKIKKVGIISGGAPRNVYQAIEEGLDAYITGEITHDVYHSCLEREINLIAGGHYYTETIGLKLLAKKLEQETSIETVFVDVPTGL